MDNLEYIDNYFKNKFAPEEIHELEKKIANDPLFAQDMAFYLSVHKLASEELIEEKKRRFRQIYQKQDTASIVRPIQRTWAYAAAAAVIICVATGVILFMKSPSQQQLADQYIEKNFNTLQVTMSSTEDSMQTGLRSYNDKNFREALRQFEKLVQSDPSNINAIKYAGITALQMKEYDKALNYFIQLENHTGLYSNPGKLYHAIILMKRGLPGDSGEAKKLLQQVVQQDLEGKQTAEEWLKKL